MYILAKTYNFILNIIHKNGKREYKNGKKGLPNGKSDDIVKPCSETLPITIPITVPRALPEKGTNYKTHFERERKTK